VLLRPGRQPPPGLDATRGLRANHPAKISNWFNWKFSLKRSSPSWVRRRGGAGRAKSPPAPAEAWVW